MQETEDAQIQHEGHPSEPGFLFPEGLVDMFFADAVLWNLRTIK